MSTRIGSLDCGKRIYKLILVARNYAISFRQVDHESDSMCSGVQCGIGRTDHILACKLRHENFCSWQIPLRSLFPCSGHAGKTSI